MRIKNITKQISIETGFSPFLVMEKAIGFSQNLKMDKKFIDKKEHPIDWIQNLEDEKTIDKLVEFYLDITFGKITSNISVIENTETFEERWAKGLTSKESKQRTLEYIKNLPWIK